MPQISWEAVQVWKAAGIRMKLIRTKGGYIVHLY